MNWIALTDEQQLETIKEESKSKPTVIFKHSTRCPISSMAKSRLEREQAPENVNFYYLDLVSFRSVSNSIASTFGVVHESPQVLVIKNGVCTYNESHNGIEMGTIAQEVE